MIELGVASFVEQIKINLRYGTTKKRDFLVRGRSGLIQIVALIYWHLRTILLIDNIGPIDHPWCI